jgi:hypothetical protein
MRLSYRFSLATLVAAALLVPATALAGEPGPEQPKADQDSSAGLKGFELMLRPGFGGAPSDSPVKVSPNGAQPGTPTLLTGASPWSSGFVGQASVGYRFIPFMSAGLRAGFRSVSASNPGDGSTNLSRTGWDGGLYLRFYPAVFAPAVSKHIDPWVSLGVGYSNDSQSLKKPLSVQGVGNIQADISVDHHAVAVPIAVGVDYRVAKFLSVGPSFELAINNPIAGCVATSAPGLVGSTVCSNTETGKNVKAETYLAWNAGLDAKVTF